ncbi:hypothetical protein NDU88_010038 [Pleurodeles waltl]|uniref:Uncharacterized protein n=1 Tax=Pleurodeles waltl TaxID=8319 RepID=A0AAV7QZ46_PLEWA|nr:hypothetical protein NDU88_010038 [Pleurodeles waltl]
MTLKWVEAVDSLSESVCSLLVSLAGDMLLSGESPNEVTAATTLCRLSFAAKREVLYLCAKPSGVSPEPNDASSPRRAPQLSHKGHTAISPRSRGAPVATGPRGSAPLPVPWLRGYGHMMLAATKHRN